MRSAVDYVISARGSSASWVAGRSFGSLTDGVRYRAIGSIVHQIDSLLSRQKPSRNRNIYGKWFPDAVGDIKSPLCTVHFYSDVRSPRRSRDRSRSSVRLFVCVNGVTRSYEWISIEFFEWTAFKTWSGTVGPEFWIKWPKWPVACCYSFRIVVSDLTVLLLSRNAVLRVRFDIGGTTASRCRWNGSKPAAVHRHRSAHLLRHGALPSRNWQPIGMI